MVEGYEAGIYTAKEVGGRKRKAERKLRDLQLVTSAAVLDAGAVLTDLRVLWPAMTDQEKQGR